MKPICKLVQVLQRCLAGAINNLYCSYYW